jgi:hypothetical protein
MRIFRNKKNKLILSTAIFSFFFALTFILSAPVFAEGGPCLGQDDITGEPTPKGCDPNFKSAGGGSNTPAGGGSNTPAGGGSNTPSSTKIDAHIENPLGDSVVDIPSFIEKILRFILMLGVPIVVLAIIYCGFLFVTALGNSEKLKKAKTALVYTLVGAALLLGAFVIAEAIQGTVVEISNEAKK